MSDEHTVAIVSEHGAVVRMVDRVKRKLAQAEQGEFFIEVYITGNAQSGRPEMSFTVGKNSYSEKVKGNNLDETLREYLRRVGWTEHNKPLELTFESNGDTPTTATQEETNKSSDTESDIPI